MQGTANDTLIEDSKSSSRKAREKSSKKKPPVLDIADDDSPTGMTEEFTVVDEANDSNFNNENSKGTKSRSSKSKKKSSKEKPLVLDIADDSSTGMTDEFNVVNEADDVDSNYNNENYKGAKSSSGKLKKKSSKKKPPVLDIADDSSSCITEEFTVVDKADDVDSNYDNKNSKDFVRDPHENLEGSLDAEGLSWKIDDEGEECTVLAEETKKSDVGVTVPSYGTNFTGILTEKEYSIETGQHVKNDCIPKLCCFNCLGDHNIQDCKEKKDYQAIARNRKSILRNRSNVRYHEMGENLYNSFKPGEISENLREALGLRPHEAPEFIYRMRVLGYPPGWLKEAEVQRSEVSLFGGDGKPLSHPEEEEGETDVRLTKYNPDKLVSFPGFNVALPSHIKDQHWEKNLPPMQSHHGRRLFLHFMKQNRATKYKRKKLKASATPQSLKEVKVASEMDVDDSQLDANTILEFNPPLPEEECPKPPEPPPEPEVTREEGELSSDSSTAVSSPAPESLEKTPSSLKRKSAVDSDSSRDSPLPLTKRLHNSSSKGFHKGVSIPDSITPYKKLPDPDKWSVDVSDHILFDNLPDALGTWQKMRGIVKNVQGVMKTLHVDDDDD